MAGFETSVVIDRPVSDVFAFTADPANYPIWQPTSAVSELTSDGPPGIGSTGRNVTKLFGRTIESEWIAREYEPDRRISIETTSGPAHWTATWTCEPANGGTRFTWTVDLKAGFGGAFGRMTDAAILGIFQRQSESNLENLKRLLEA